MTAAAPAFAASPPLAVPLGRPRAWEALAAVGVIAIGIVARISAGAGTPLWFDETFSAVIASQPSVAALVDWCRSEIGGPVYYMLLWLWAQVFGTGTVALRAMSFAASVAAPALVAWKGHPDRLTRLMWAALLALWLPGLDQATNARCYALAELATTVQAIAYWRLIADPTRSRALAWTAVSSLALLIHLHTAALAGVGGLIFLAVHRRRAIACWPALVTLVPVAAWIAFQSAVLAKFGGGGSWYQPFGIADVLLAPLDLFESLLLGLVLTIGPVLAHLRGWRGEAPVADRALAASGLLALVAVIALTLVKPSFAWRYAIPFGPAILFAVAIWARGLRAFLPLAPAIVVALFASSALGRIGVDLARPTTGYRFEFTLQLPSDWLAEHGARHLAFLWDSPTGAMSDPRRIDEVVGYFLRRRGALDVTMLRAPAASRPSAVVAGALARDRSIDSLIWIADRNVPGTHQEPDRQMLARIGWACRNFSHPPMYVVTCHAPDR